MRVGNYELQRALNTIRFVKENGRQPTVKELTGVVVDTLLECEEVLMSGLKDDRDRLAAERKRITTAIGATEQELVRLRDELKSTDRDYYTALAYSATVKVTSGPWSYVSLSEAFFSAVGRACNPDILVVSDYTHKKFYCWMIESVFIPIGKKPPPYEPDGMYKFMSATLHRGDVDDNSLYFINENNPDDAQLNVLLRIEEATSEG